MPPDYPLQILLQPTSVGVVVAFIFCSLIGSFLNVVIYRLPLARSVVLPPSACVTCGVPLKWWQNVPIVSYLVLCGRCYTCGSVFSARYALMEAFVAGVGAFMFWFFGGAHWSFFYWFTLFAVSTAVFFVDLDHWVIPDQLNLFGVLFGVLGSLFLPPRGGLALYWLPQGPVANLASSLAGALVGAGFFWAIQAVGLVLAKQEAMGGGDVRYAAVLGAFLGVKMAFVAFLLSFVLGAGVALPMLVLGRGKGKDPIPFGTFMAVAAVVVALWGDRIVSFVLGIPFYYGP